jgi:hypothetical protein
MWSLGMILHKLIFFRLPYRWAAYGDRPGLYGADARSADDDDGKDADMDRLEREVSSYPGFKSTPRLETQFVSRRLSRSYLVLLESLLNIAPASRPSCEKVLAALHLGKVCTSSSSIARSVLCSWFAVQPHSAKVEHVGCSHAQNNTGIIRRRLHLVIGPSDSRTHNDVTSFVPYAAPAPFATFRAEQ